MSVTSSIWRMSSAGFSEQKLSGLSPGTFLSATNRLACSNKRVTKEASFDPIISRLAIFTNVQREDDHT